MHDMFYRLFLSRVSMLYMQSAILFYEFLQSVCLSVCPMSKQMDMSSHYLTF